MFRLPRLFWSLLVSLCLLGTAAEARAAQSPFDLVGPGIRVAVTRGGLTLPIEWVPNLAAGDRLSIKLDLPAGQDERFRLIAAFLRGATDRPPERWFHDAKTWQTHGTDLSLVVPEGAQQVALFLMPEEGGDIDAVVDAVRRRPGTFVRAAQELNQASLDRARLDTFLRLIRRVERDGPEKVAAASQVLTSSLSIKLNMACLEQPVDLQASCLADGREAMLLADTHSSALVSTLTGAPTDLAFQLSATPQGGYGYYSPYIGVVRDIFRIFGAFQSTQLQYIPALSRLSDDQGTLLLNAPLSFGKPTSVMVTGLPAIEAPKPPPLRRAGTEGALCAAPGLVLPVEGAPLVYATHYAHNMVFRIARSDGRTLDIPVYADAARGGFVTRGAIPTEGLGPVIEGRLHGNWGFTPFDGPRFTLANPNAGTWDVAEGESAVAGRQNLLGLVGGPADCVSKVEMRYTGSPARAIEWEPAGTNKVVLTLPLEKAPAGPVTLLIHQAGRATPQTVIVPAMREVGRIEALTLHAGDDRAVLTGTRLDQVSKVMVGSIAFQPAGLTRVDQRDRLALTAIDPDAASVLSAGSTLSADIIFAGDRRKRLAVTVAPPRPRAELVRVSAQVEPRPGFHTISLEPDDIVPQDAQLTFAFRLTDGETLTGREVIEVASADGRATTRIVAGKGYDPQDARTGIVALIPSDTLGPVAYGPVKFRIVRPAGTSDWVPLATIVRLPEISAIDCASAKCMLTGDRLFLIDAIASTGTFADPVEVPDGFTATRIETPPATAGKLFLRLRDDPDAIATVMPH